MSDKFSKLFIVMIGIGIVTCPAFAQDESGLSLPDLEDQLEYGSIDERISAAQTLARLAVESEEALVSFAIAFDDYLDITEEAKAALHQHHTPDSIAALLASEEPLVKSAAARMLGGFERDAMEQVDDLLRALTDEDANVRRSAALAIGSIAPATVEPVYALVRAYLVDPETFVQDAAEDALFEMLDEKDPRIQQAALWILSRDSVEERRAGLDALSYVLDVSDPVLERVFALTRDENELVRRSAVAAIWDLVDDDPALRALRPLLDDPDPGVRAFSAAAIADIDEESPVPVDDLVGLLRDADSWTRTTAGYLLAEHPEAARSALPELERLLSDPDANVRGQAAIALEEIGVPTTSILPLVRLILLDPVYDVRDAADDALSSLPEAALVDIAQALEDLLDSPDPSIQLRVLRGVADMDVETPSLSQKISGFLDNDSEAMRQMAMEALARRSNAGFAAPRILQIAQASDGYEQQIAIETLGEIGEDASFALPQLMSFLEHEDVVIRGTALHAISRIGPDEEQLMDILVSALGDPEPGIRAAAAEHIREAGVDARSAVDELSALLKDDDNNVSTQAYLTLLDIEQSGPPQDASTSILSFGLAHESTSFQLQALRRAVEQDRPLTRGEELLLLELTESTDDRVRYSAIQALGRVRVETARAAAILVDAYLSAEGEPPYRVARALESLNAPDVVAPLVLPKLRAGNISVRARAAELLGEYSAQPGVADGLAGALQDRNPAVRAAAATGLRFKRNLPAHLVTALVAALDDRIDSVRLAAVEAMQFRQNIGEVAIGRIIDLIGSDNPAIRRAAVETLGSSREATAEMSRRATLALIAAYESGDANVSAAARQSLSRGQRQVDDVLAFVHELSASDQAERRKFAAEIMVNAAGDKDVIINTLALLAEDVEPGVRAAAASGYGNWQLRELGEKVAPTIARLLADEDRDVRLQAAITLDSYDKLESPQILEVVQLMAKDGDVEFRKAALRALNNLADDDDVALTILIDALEDESDEIRLAAVQNIGLMFIGNTGRTGARAATIGLVGRLSDDSVEIQQAAIRSLGHIGQDAHEAVPALAEIATDSSSDAQIEAIAALGSMREAARIAVPELAGLLRTEDSRLRIAVLEALAGMGETAIAAVPRVAELFSAAEPEIRRAASRALIDVGRYRDGVATDSYLQLLSQDPDAEVRRIAAESFENRDQRDTTVADALIAAARDASPQVRAAAIRSLGQRRELADSVLPELSRAVDDGEASVRQAAATAFQSMGEIAASETQSVIRLMEDSDANVRRAAIRAAGRVGKDDAIVRALGIALDDEDDDYRGAAAAGLVQLGPGAAAALPFLVDAVGYDDENLRQLAAVALGNLGAEPNVAIPILLDVVEQDPRNRHLWDLKEFALEAIRLSAIELLDKERVEALPALNAAWTALEDKPEYAEVVRTVSLAARNLDRIESEGSDSTEFSGQFDLGLAPDARLTKVYINNRTGFDIDAKLDNGVIYLSGTSSAIPDFHDGAHSLVVDYEVDGVEDRVGPIVFWRERGQVRRFDLDEGNRYAVVIGISDYSNDPEKLNDLVEAPIQARALGAYLERSGYEVEYFLDDEQGNGPVTKEVIEDYLDLELGPRLDPERDVVFFYFGGHGIPAKDQLNTNDAYLLVNGYDRDLLHRTAISVNRDIKQRYAAHLGAKHILFALDACFADVSTRSAQPVSSNLTEFTYLSEIRTRTRDRGRAMFTAGTEDELAIDENGGIFTKALMRGLRGEGSDYDKNGVITLNELEAFVYKDVIEAARIRGHRQTPNLTEIYSGDRQSGQFIHYYRGWAAQD